MHYILYVQLDRFYVSALARQDPKTRELPVIVHRDKRVLDLNALAQSCGIFTGMALQEAKTLLKSASGVSITWQEDRFVEAQEQWLDRCAEMSDVVEPEAQHSAYLDLTAQPAPLDFAEDLQVRLAERGEFGARFGMARGKWIARLACEQLGGIACDAQWRAMCEQAVHDPAGFLAGFPTAYLCPVLPEHRRRLEFLGYRTIGEVAGIPSQVLRDQFGAHAPAIHAAARGGCGEAVAPLYPSDRVLATVGFEGGAESLEALQNGILLLAKRIGKSLTRKDASGADLEVQIEFENGSVDTRKRRFAKPILDGRSANSALRLLIGEWHPAGVIRLSATLSSLKKIERSQPKLTGEASDTARPTNLDNAFVAIRTVFGDKAIQSAGEIVLPRRTRVLKAWKEATGWV